MRSQRKRIPLFMEPKTSVAPYLGAFRTLLARESVVVAGGTAFYYGALCILMNGLFLDRCGLPRAIVWNSLIW
jgi:hypothetical protein